MTDLRALLNPEQFEAATAPDGPLLILAAAGTGKTRTLVYRVVHLQERGVPPDRILLLTFTNRAAREMLSRAGEVAPGACDGLWGGTFHHVANRMLRRYAGLLGFPRDFAILDADDQRTLMGRVIKDLGHRPKDFPKRELVLSLLSGAVNRNLDPAEYLESRAGDFAAAPEELLACMREYVKRKRELHAMDFDDLLVNGLRVLSESAEARELYQERFLHVLVDEYQDTNALQSAFVDLLAARHRNLSVVGDDFQCIYSWRGSDYRNIMDFPDRWEGCRILKLERNYRSLSPILDVANAVMKDVPHQFEKTLRPFRTGAAPKPRLYHVYDARAQAEAILRLVGVLRQNGIAYRDIAVLYRSHYTSIDIQMTLTRNRVPFRITSGMGVFEQLHVKDVLSFLRLCLDPRAELSFLRLMQLLPGVGENSARKFWQKLGGAFDPLNPMDRMNLGSMMNAKGMPAWKLVDEAYSHAKEHLAAGHDRLLIEDFTRLFYADHLHRSFDPEDADSRLDDLNELAAQIASASGGLRQFLDEVALMTNLDAQAKASLPADHMTLTTVHQAKGMEWPVVILPWLVDTIFPNARAIEDGNLDEERRLFYVAVTRAKDRLYMCVPRVKKTPDGGVYPVDPSTFIRDVPTDLLEEQTLYSNNPDDDGASRRRGDIYGGYGDRYGGRYGGGRYGGNGRYGRGGGTSYTTTWRR